MEDISLHLLDLAQNSISAGASLVEIFIVEDTHKGQMIVTLRDNGHGMDESQVKRVTDPFFTTRNTRRVGLGIPLFQASTEATGGQMYIKSCKGRGTEIKAVFHTTHIDCLPLGRVDDTILSLILLNPEIDFVYSHKKQDKHFLLDTRQIREVLGQVSIENPSVIEWIRKYLSDGLEEINGGV